MTRTTKQAVFYLLSVLLWMTFVVGAASAQRAVAPPNGQASRGGRAAQQPDANAATTQTQQAASAQKRKALEADAPKRTAQQASLAVHVVQIYIVSFQKQVGLNDEQALRLSAPLQTYVQKR